MGRVKTPRSPTEKLFRTFSLAFDWREQSLLPADDQQTVIAKKWVAGKAAAFQRDFAKGLRQQREERNLTLDQLATRAEVTTIVLSAYESGDKLPTKEIAAKLRLALETSG